MNSPYRVAIVTSIHPDYDGRIWRHAKSLAAAGVEVHLICPWNISSGSTVDGVHIIPFRRIRSRSFRIFLVPYRIMPLLVRIMRNIELIHFHDIDLIPTMLFVRLFRPVIYDVHENYPDEMLVRHWIPRFFRRPLYWIVRIGQYLSALIIQNVVLVVPDQERDFPRRHIRKFILRNYGSIDLLAQVERGYSERPHKVVFIGSQYPENGTLLILEIAEALRTLNVKTQILCSDRFSNKTLRDTFLHQIRSQNLEGYIALVPNVPPNEIMSVLNMARIGLLANLRVPKQIKALPTKLFEYMAASLPVVASDLPLISRYVVEADCGLLADPGDPKSFALAIKQLLDDTDRAMHLGNNGSQAFLSRFSWESQLPDLIKFYGVVLRR